MIARGALALVAIVVLAWLGVMERDARLLAPGSLAGADADFRRARFLNPDTTPDLYRSALYSFRGQWRHAAATADSVLRREPENLAAWRALFLISRGHDPASARRAEAAIHRLDPLDADRITGMRRSASPR